MPNDSYSMERDCPEERLCAFFEAWTTEVLGLEQGAPASFTKTSQYPTRQPLYYGASFVHPVVGSDGERLSALQTAFGVIFEKQVFFLARL